MLKRIRTVMKACKGCIDGVGEAADITLADDWYIKDSNKPNFTDREGRNAVFARMELESEIFEEMRKAN